MTKTESSVLGIGYFVVHDSNTAVISSNGISFACSEERITRKKRDGAIPYKTLELTKSIHGRNTPIVCSYYDPPQYLTAHKEITNKNRINLETNLAHTNVLRSLGVTHFMGHHFSHAAGAYFTSGFDNAIVITYDGGILCEPWLATIWRGSHGRLVPLRKITRLEGAVAAIRYSGVTSLLGFRPVYDEGKITGLAAYGTPSEDCIRVLHNAFSSTNEPQSYWDGSFAKEFSWIRNKFSDKDIAASIQHITEISVINLIHETVTNVNETCCALAGGLFANVRLNRKIKELGFKKLYVYPAMGDEGLGLGAALGFLGDECSDQFRLDHVFLGPSFSGSEIENEIVQSGLSYQDYDNIEERVAELLAQGYVVARFNGPMEFGPRALGNRSILYQTTEKEVNHWLNKHLNRTEFMPFAPVTLANHAQYLYKNLDGLERCTPFMTVAVDCTEKMKELSPGVIHVDGTARPQIVSYDSNPSLYRILENYYQLTGIPSLINTSFNMHGEPIVCSPRDAIRCFIQGELHYLAIGNFLIKHPNHN